MNIIRKPGFFSIEGEDVKTIILEGGRVINFDNINSTNGTDIDSVNRNVMESILKDLKSFYLKQRHPSPYEKELADINDGKLKVEPVESTNSKFNVFNTDLAKKSIDSILEPFTAGEKYWIDKKLELVREIQNQFPECCLGGSLGLYLHGIKLNRSLEYSDIDIIGKCDLDKIQYSKKLCASSDDFQQVKMVKVEDRSIKVEVSEKEIINIGGKDYIYIEYEGHFYCVNNLETILRFKKEYANKGSKKHYEDMKVIDPTWVCKYDHNYDLPF